MRVEPPNLRSTIALPLSATPQYAQQQLRNDFAFHTNLSPKGNYAGKTERFGDFQLPKLSSFPLLFSKK
jgi:hypothetical protein